MDGARERRRTWLRAEEKASKQLLTAKSPGEWGDYFQLFAKIFILNSGQSSLQFILDRGGTARAGQPLHEFGISGPFSRCK